LKVVDNVHETFGRGMAQDKEQLTTFWD